MRRLISILSLAALWPLGASWAQLSAPNEAGVSMGHLHLNVRDLDASKKFWMALGAKPLKLGETDVMKFPDVLILLRQAEPSGGSVGSIVNHMGFRVPNVQASIVKWKAAGFQMETSQRLDQVYIIGPDDLRIEILENPSLAVPMGTPHVHFYAAEAPVLEMQAWYGKMFGAKPAKKGNNEGADIPGVSLTFSPSPTPTVPTKGRVLDHIGFEIKNLEAFCQKLEANGVKFDRPYSKVPSGNFIAFLTDPWGTTIELTEGLNKL